MLCTCFLPTFFPRLLTSLVLVSTCSSLYSSRFFLAFLSSTFLSRLFLTLPHSL
eukprot:m.181613 g.181613  ORF g.181613 m.181613 type:complete len:54 (+) comp25458_c1_seq2:71-232(+)